MQVPPVHICDEQSSLLVHPVPVVQLRPAPPVIPEIVHVGPTLVIGRLAWAHRAGTRQTAATAAAVGIEQRFAEVSGEVKGRYIVNVNA